MKAIQEELGGTGSHKEVEEMRKQASKKHWSKDISNAFHIISTQDQEIFTFTATDSYGASASDDVLISILNEPASAAITNLSTEHGLYYVTVSFDEGVLEEDSRYTGDLDNSVGYDIFRDGILKLPVFGDLTQKERVNFLAPAEPFKRCCKSCASILCCNEK